MKGLSSEEFAARNDLVLALPDRIENIPDGTAPAPKKAGGWTTSASRAEIKFDSGCWSDLAVCSYVHKYFFFLKMILVGGMGAVHLIT